MKTQIRFGRSACAVVACAGSLALHQAASAVIVDAPVTPSTVTPNSYIASMPVLPAGSNLQLAPTITSNLGTFDIVIVPGATLSGNAAALAAFNRAAQQWEAVMADPITITINADLAPLGAGILGSTGSTTLAGAYNTVRNQMVVDAADEADDAVVGSLPTAAQYTTFVPSGFGLDGNVQLTQANAKALGFAVGAGPDGAITFSTNFNFDFDNSDGVTAGQYDFESVAAHEIGHALGFVSEVDYVDFVKSQASTANDIEPTTLDLFRFRGDVNDPTTFAEFTSKPRSMVAGSVDHFDQINGAFGGSVEVLVSTGLTQGDGRQASHWKDSLGLGIMDPTLSAGEISVITANDLRAFDLIGYEIVVPEPGSLALLSGAGVALLARRRRHARI